MVFEENKSNETGIELTWWEVGTRTKADCCIQQQRDG